MTTVQSISEDQLEKTLATSLNNIAKNEGFVNYQKQIRAISTNGDNYMGDLFEVDIKEVSADEDKELKLFIKCMKQMDEASFLRLQDQQAREILVYNELNTLYTQLMNEANIPETERYKQARCYDATDKFIILENLSVRGYTTLERTTPLSFGFAELAIKELARFHALSFVLQTKDTKYFNKKYKQLEFPINIKSDHHKSLIKDLTDISCGFLDENSEKRIRAAYEKIHNLEKFYGESSSRKCICHGDYRGNNLIVKQENGNITDLLPVDFQLTHFGNPMNDFWYLLILHTDREFRSKHLTTLKELYYDTLTQYLKYFHIDVSNVYPRQEFEVDYKEEIYLGLHIAVKGLLFVFSRNDTVPDIGNITSLKSNVKLQDNAKERFQGMVDDFIEWGII